jgi:hypothetical protein
LKWQSLHPALGRYDFDGADRYVAFGQKHGMFVVGHCLVWHSQVPRWVFKDADGHALTRDALLERMRDHIHTVVGRYKGPHRRVGCRQRSPQRRRNPAGIALDVDHRRGLSREGLSVRARGRPLSRALLQRLLARRRCKAARRSRPATQTAGGRGSRHGCRPAGSCKDRWPECAEGSADDRGLRRTWNQGEYQRTRC